MIENSEGKTIEIREPRKGMKFKRKDKMANEGAKSLPITSRDMNVRKAV